jgi:hypothetical protein
MNMPAWLLDCVLNGTFCSSVQGSTLARRILIHSKAQRFLLIVTILEENNTEMNNFPVLMTVAQEYVHISCRSHYLGPAVPVRLINDVILL